MTRREAVKLLNRGNNQLLLSLLYDLNLLPEHVKSGTKQEFYMLTTIEHFEKLRSDAAGEHHEEGK